jgi:dienelactone hydrolase
MGFVICALLLAVSTAEAAELHRLEQPWPSGAALELLPGDSVRFPSTSPFNPVELDGTAPPAQASGTLFVPKGSHRPRSIPAVILLHGSAGVIHAREITYARQYAGMGVAALVIDTFGARRDMGQGFVERLLNITETMMIADAYAGLRYLASRPEIDVTRVALIGFSYGGMASMYALNARVAERLGRGMRFAAHVAYYAPCIARFADPRTTGAPLLMLYGTADILINRERCEEFAADLRAAGSEVRIIAYEGAAHQWDGPWARRYTGRNLAPCRFVVEHDGTVRDQRTFLPMNGPLLRRIILGLCTRSEQYLIGSDDDVRARSNSDVGRFLRQALRPPQ